MALVLSQEIHKTTQASPGHLVGEGPFNNSLHCDLLLIGQSYKQCVDTIIATLTLFEKLGFVIHPSRWMNKSSFLANMLN
jgi:hypothetical protein